MTSEIKDAKATAFKRLGRRECSARDIQQHLVRKGTSAEAAAAAVAALVQGGYISDERYARMLVREQLGQGKGPGVIRRKLRENGIEMTLETLRTLAEEFGAASEMETASRLIERRYPEAVSDRKEAARAYQALLRRGFSFDVARNALAQLIK